MKRIKPFFLLTTLSVLAACAGGNKADVNPNGSSELAVLMRDMFDDGMKVKTNLLAGGEPQIECNYSKIHTAKPTEASKTENPVFPTFASAYEASVTAFKSATPYQRVDAYQHMVTSCIDCHNEICPGPIRKIKKLYLSEKEIADFKVD
jgi:hypothetical protein